MKTFVAVDFDRIRLARELDDLETFLCDARRERAEIAPFFKSRRNLCAALSLTNSAVETPDRMATELDLFGDFCCDAASGDSTANAYTLIEFEDAQPFSIFTRLEPTKTMKRWSPRFEHGFSQLVDWAWRLSAEDASSAALTRIFGAGEPTIHFSLIVGRDSDLGKDDLARLRWRANHISLGAFRMSCFTFDGVLRSLRRRLQLAS